MLDRCPTCGKTTGTLMETHADRPGLMQILQGESGEAQRIIVTVALCIVVALAIVATEGAVPPLERRPGLAASGASSDPASDHAA